jgi:hypothetical protein
MDKQSQNHDRLIPVPSQVNRRALVGWAAKVATGTLTATIPGGRFVQEALADDDDVVILTAAIARSAAAEAAAARGMARVQAAAALAEADSDDGAIAQGAAAVAAADPDQGAIAQSAAAVASASSQDDVAEAPPSAPRAVAPAPGGGGVGRGGGGRRVRGGGGERIRGGRRTGRAVGGERARRRDRPESLPSAGIGQLEQSSLPSLFTIASAVAALGAVVLRDRDATARAAEVVVSSD